MSRMKRKFEKLMREVFPTKNLNKDEYGSYVDERVSCMWDIYILMYRNED